MSTDDHTTDGEDTLAAQQAAALRDQADTDAALARSAESDFLEAQLRDRQAHAEALADGLEEVGEGEDLAEYVHGNLEVRR